MTQGRTFYGKYRGFVTNNQDSSNLGRIRAKVPDVAGDIELGWAWPCAPYGGNGMGLFAIPDVGAYVWIEFECGDPEYPIWSGCWWPNSDQMPEQVRSAGEKKVLLRTKNGHKILLDDDESNGGITIEAANGQKLILNSNGIELDNGNGAKIKLTGNQASINDGALEVT